MTEQEITIAKNLGNVSVLPGGFDKRFIRQISSLAENNPEKELSEKQKEWMFRLVYKYRRQIPNTYEYCKNDPMCSKLEKIK
jgi:hypothetical protein